VCDLEHGGLQPFSYYLVNSFKKLPTPRDACGERRNASSHQASCCYLYFRATEIPRVPALIPDTPRRNSRSDTLLTA